MKIKFDKNRLILLLILIIGTAFRLINLDKNGLWYDEVGTLSVAKESFPFGILNTLYHKDVHCPLFYFILHFWIKAFGFQEFVLRLFSAILGTFNIIIFYLAGKELGSRNSGLITAFIASISSFLIYFSQEIRFYPLILLLTTLSLLFLMRFDKKPSVKNLIGLTLSNLGILYSYTLGSVFVLIESIIFLTYLCIKAHKKQGQSDIKHIKTYINSQILSFVLFLPYLPTFFHHLNVSSNSFLNFFDWGNFKIFDIFVTIQNWFSPFIFVFQHDYEKTYSSYFEIFGETTFLIIFSIVAIIPIIFHLVGIIRAVFKKQIAVVIFLIFLAFFSYEILMSVNQKFILHGKYTVLNLPLLVILAGYGISQVKYSKFIITYLLILNLFYLNFVSFSAPNMQRSTAYNKLAKTFDEYNLTSYDKIIISHGSRYVKDYFPKHSSIVFPLDLEYVYFYRQNFILEKIFDKAFITGVNKENARERFRDFIKNPEPSEKFENYLKNELIDKMSDNSKLAVYINRMTGKYESAELQEITLDTKEYYDLSLARMLISKTSNDIVFICRKYLVLVDFKKEEGKEIYLFRKSNSFPNK